MKDVVAYCHKAIVKTEDSIEDKETHLKMQQKGKNTRALKRP